MPYIATQVSTPLTPEKEKVLKERFGQAIELLGKDLLGVKLFDFVAGHAGDVGLEGEGVGLGFV